MKKIFSNIITSIVAESAEQAMQICMEMSGCPGCSHEDSECCTDVNPFTERDPNKFLTIWDENGENPVTKTCREWAKDEEIGFLGSTEV